MLKDIHNRLRPMGIADILDETVDIYRNNFALLIGITALVYVPFSVIGSMFRVPLLVDTSIPPEQMISEIIKAALPQLVLVFVLTIFVIPLITGALTLALSERYLARKVSIGEVYRRILKGNVFFPFMGAFLLKYLAVGAAYFSGIVLVFVMGVMAGMIGPLALLIAIPFGCGVIFAMAYIWLRFVVVEPAFIVEMRGAVNSLGRSWNLMGGNVGRAFVLMLIVILVMFVISGVVSGPIEAVTVIRAMNHLPVPDWLTVAGAVMSTAVNVLTLPLYSIVAILLYYDLRIRKEGFDLELLASELDAGSPEITQQFAPAPTEQALPKEDNPQPRGEDSSHSDFP